MTSILEQIHTNLLHPMQTKQPHAAVDELMKRMKNFAIPKVSNKNHLLFGIKHMKRADV